MDKENQTEETENQSDIVDRLKKLRQHLVTQSRDKIGMDDYTDQIAAYQRILNEHILLSIETAELLIKLLASMGLVKTTDHAQRP